MIRKTSALVLMLAATVAIAPAASAGTFKGPKAAKTVAFQGDASQAASLTSGENLEIARGAKTVIIPQFTVEFFEESDGLGVNKNENISVNYHLAGVDDAAKQAIVDRLYERYVASLKAKGVTVLGPREAASSAAWTKVLASAQTAPADLQRGGGSTRIFSALNAPYLPPIDAKLAPGAAAQTTATASKGLAMGGMLSSKLAGAASAARGASALASFGAGMGTFNSALAYAKAEPDMATELNGAVMTVRLVVGLRETDKSTQLFASLRTASSLIGAPRLVVLSEASNVSVYAPNPKLKRAQLKVNDDLLFSEDLFEGRMAIRNGAVGAASNLAARGAFLTSVVAGGGVDLHQSHNVDCTPETAAFNAAVERNLAATTDMFIQQLGL